MYATEVKGKKLTLSVSGMLWQRSLVMYDRETRGLWSHILGKCMRGPLKGTELKQIPSVMTDWQSWRRLDPEGTVAMLSRTSKNYRREFYRKPKRFVLGIAEEGSAHAWSFDQLQRTPVMSTEWQKTPAVIVYDNKSTAARMYDRKVKDRTLTFAIKKGKLTDKETGSTWEPVTGKAIAGPLKGTYLKALPAIVSYRRTWFQFHPLSGLNSLPGITVPKKEG